MVGAAIVVFYLGGCGSGRNGATGVSGPTPESFGRVPDSPFGVTVTRDGRYAFVDLVGGRVLVYSVAGSALRLLRTVRVPVGEAVGSSLTRDGRLLLVASGRGATVLSVSRLERGAPRPVLGTLSPPPRAHLQALGAIETASSADGRYVFVSLEYGAHGGAIAVYDLRRTGAPHFGAGDYVGAITLGDAVVGSALSPDGRYLYVTSELAAHHRGVAGHEPQGTLSVIGVTTAERDPGRAVLATVPAQHEPVRVAVSPDGSVVWVTARASNRLLAFSAARLLTHPARALIAEVTVGAAPVGVAIFDHGDRVIVADSNRFNTPGAHAAVTVIDARAALAHRPAVIATLPSGAFPRELAVAPNDKLVLVSNFASDQIESVNVSRLQLPGESR